MIAGRPETGLSPAPRGNPWAAGTGGRMIDTIPEVRGTIEKASRQGLIKLKVPDEHRRLLRKSLDSMLISADMVFSYVVYMDIRSANRAASCGLYSCKVYIIIQRTYRRFLDTQTCFNSRLS